MTFLIIKWLFLHLRLGFTLFAEFLPSLPSWPIFAFSIVFSIYWYGHSHGVDACETAHAKADLKLEKKNVKIKEHNNSIGHDQLNRGLQPYYRD